MSSHPTTTQTKHDNSTQALNKKENSGPALSEGHLGLREFARRKFTPAIKRAKDDDDRQAVFTSAAGNLVTAGWILTELALRVSELADKRMA